MRTADFDFSLPPDQIAQYPSPTRDSSRLLVLDRKSGKSSHHQFVEISRILRPNDLLVLNNSKVFPARLRGFKLGSGGVIEILLLEETAPMEWWAMVKPGKRVRPGSCIVFPSRSRSGQEFRAEVLEKNELGHVHLRFIDTASFRDLLEQTGEIPLPPYIVRSQNRLNELDQIRYQTVYAQVDGSVAAPTAGLHFTEKILEDLKTRGVDIQFVTLHVGYGTFSPVKTESVADHRMHEERFDVPEVTAHAIARARAEGRRIVSIGTTTTRVLESVARQNDGRIVAGPGRTQIFLYPPAQFKVVDVLLTNFHLPQSTLLMLVSAFAAPGEVDRGRFMVLNAYAEAVREGYRFFSYGDAMLIGDDV